MFTQALSLMPSQSPVVCWSSSANKWADRPLKIVDPLIHFIAWQALKNGECFKWAINAPIFARLPEVLNNKVLCWIEDSGTLVKSGFEIKTRIDGILAAGASHEAKVKGMMEAVQLALDVAGTRMVDSRAHKHRPWMRDARSLTKLKFQCEIDRQQSKSCLYEGCTLMTAAKAGIAFAHFCSDLKTLSA